MRSERVTFTRSLGALLFSVGALLTSTALLSCSDVDPSEDDGSTGGGSLEASCDDWKEAYCGSMQKCGTTAESACQDQVSTVQCKSSAPLSRCVTELTQDCDAPDDCDAVDVADLSQARSQCSQFQQAYCQNVMTCQPTAYYSLSACINALDAYVPCDQAYAVSKNYDRCLADLNAGSCGQYLPSSCETVVLLQ